MKTVAVDESVATPPSIEKSTLDVLAQRIADWVDAEILRAL